MSKLPLKCPLLCLITDVEVPDLVKIVETALSAGVTMLQLRGHQLSAAQLHRLALEIGPLCQYHQAIFILNDRVDIGLAAGANGFQLGKHSLPLAVVRDLVGADYVLGASVHSLEEAQIAVANGADFLLAGTIFSSRSHPGEAPSSPSLLQDIKQTVPTMPLLAVGGITTGNARQVMAAGADGIAVITAILGASDVTRVVRELRTTIGL